ncbi:MAG TPA: helix-turn-helix transcriptional regulator [Pyrinomonadaceae bacterium]|jgi:transcriptional regulator with XRE-family HTH domain|nr:helix-turn-helix transcriptional regulator [Pyrinomonadaceae bacterium]
MGRKARPRIKRLPKKLRQIRLALGLSQTAMLKRLGAEDLITYHQISRFETGTREPPFIVLLRYARVAGISTDVLIDDKLNLPAKLPKG